MKYLYQFFLSVVLFGLLMSILRYLGITSGVIDWVLLISCSLIPLLNKNLREGNLSLLIALIIVNAVTMFWLALWIVMMLFGDSF